MNRLLLEAAPTPGELVLVRGEAAVHLRRVLKVEPGDTVRLGVACGPRGTGTVHSLEDDGVRLSVELEAVPPAPPSTSLVLAIARPKVLRRVIAAAASVGVLRVDLLRTWRVERGYLDSPKLAPGVLAKAAWLGAEQGAHTWVPEVHVHRRFMGFVEEVLPTLPEARGVVLHPTAERWLEEVVTPGAQRLCIGPEGGFVADELASLTEAGFEPARLVDAVLTVESAVPAALVAVARAGRDIT